MIITGETFRQFAISQKLGKIAKEMQNLANSKGFIIKIEHRARFELNTIINLAISIEENARSLLNTKDNDSL